MTVQLREISPEVLETKCDAQVLQYLFCKYEAGEMFTVDFLSRIRKLWPGNHKLSASFLVTGYASQSGCTRHFGDDCSVDKSGIIPRISKHLKALNVDTFMSVFVSKPATIRILCAVCCQYVRNSAMRFALRVRIPVRRPCVNLGCLVCFQTGLLLSHLLFWWRSLFCILRQVLLTARFHRAPLAHRVNLGQKAKRPATNPANSSKLLFLAVTI